MGIVAKTTDDSLFLQYQPIVELKTGKIFSFEALVRLVSKKLGVVSPAEFIPIAEETQLIVPLGKKIIQMACVFLKELEDRGLDEISVSVNISALQLIRDEFLDDLFNILEITKVKATRLGVELTESIFADNYSSINEKLTILKAKGIRIAIDDFGTGYSSLARERELNVNCVKIDKCFIDKLLYLDDREAITGDIVSMAHRLGHCVVAEGVEHERQREYLVRHGCDFMQGYLFSRPVSPEAAIKLAKEKRCR